MEMRINRKNFKNSKKKPLNHEEMNCFDVNLLSLVDILNICKFKKKTRSRWKQIDI